MKNFLNLLWYTLTHPRAGIRDVREDVELQNSIIIIAVLSLALSLIYSSLALEGGLIEFIDAEQFFISAFVRSWWIYLIIFFIYTFLLERIGEYLGGKGSVNDMRIVIAWSSLPWIIGFYAVLIASYALFGEAIFGPSDPVYNDPSSLYALFFLIKVIGFIISVTYMIIMLSELHHISKAGAFFTMAYSLVSLVIFVIAFRYGMYYLLNFIA